MNLFGNLGTFFAPAITGIIVARTGAFTNALLAAGGILIVGILAYVWLLGRIETIPEPG